MVLQKNKGKFETSLKLDKWASLKLAVHRQLNCGIIPSDRQKNTLQSTSLKLGRLEAFTT